MADYRGFELIREQEIPEYNTLARWFRHTKSGAELLSLENDDENKVFGITFRTPANDSTGVGHIMEHAVLCGSRKYPVKEPFVELIKGSIHTFLNAFTYPDRTCYPVASTNLKDFYNLIDVYLDAVFYPNLTPFTLQQEGWHYELDEPDKPLQYKGVVFNEMKGNYSSPDRILSELSQNYLFPETTYRHESGGHPRDIPRLTWEQFKHFHETYYHPANSRIYFYGDDPLEERLAILDSYLRDFDRIEVNSEVGLQKPWSKPKTVREKYPASDDPEQNKTMLTVNWLLAENDTPLRGLALAVTGHILLGTPASPLHKALIDSGYGEDVTGVGIETELRQIYFSTGLKGVGDENVDKVERLVIDTLSALCSKGIDPHTVEASMNTVEFRLRENNTGSYPRGLALMLRCLAYWLYNRDPIDAIGFEKPLSKLKKQLAKNPRYFEGIIDTYFLRNPHRLTLILEPDADLRQQEEARERSKLERVKQSLTREELLQIIENTRELRARQEKPDDPEALAKIPSLHLQDLEREAKKIPLAEQQVGEAKILYHDLFTNGIVYLALGFDYHCLPEDLLPYLPLYSRCLLEIGTTEESFVQLFQRIGRKTGGISPSVYNNARLHSSQATTLLLLRGKALMSQTGELLAIMNDMLRKIQLDNRERFLQMVLEEKANLEAGLIPGGHGYVNTRLRARFSESGWLSERLGGVSYLFFIRELVEQVKSNWPAVLAKLEEIHKRIFTRHNLICNVTLDAENWATFEPELRAFLKALPAQPQSAQTWNREAAFEFEGLTVPTQVNFVAKGANLYELGYTFHGSALVIQKFLRTTWLWERIRVQGGAYGGFCTFDRRTGVFSFVSYRDPNLQQTLESYDKTADFLRQVPLLASEIERSIIGTIGDLDAYQLPDARGYTSMDRYLAGETDETIQQIRDEVLSTTEADFRHFADVLDMVREHGVVEVLGSPEAIAAANENGRLRIIKVI